MRPHPADYHPHPAEYQPRPAAYHPHPAERGGRPADYHPNPAGYRPHPADHQSHPSDYRRHPAALPSSEFRGDNQRGHLAALPSSSSSWSRHADFRDYQRGGNERGDHERHADFRGDPFVVRDRGADLDPRGHGSTELFENNSARIIQNHSGGVRNSRGTSGGVPPQFRPRDLPQEH